MNYQSYLYDAQGKKFTRAQRRGHNSRARMNEVYEHNKKLHSSRVKKNG